MRIILGFQDGWEDWLRERLSPVTTEKIYGRNLLNCFGHFSTTRALLEIPCNCEIISTYFKNLFTDVCLCMFI